MRIKVNKTNITIDKKYSLELGITNNTKLIINTSMPTLLIAFSDYIEGYAISKRLSAKNYWTFCSYNLLYNYKSQKYDLQFHSFKNDLYWYELIDCNKNQ